MYRHLDASKIVETIEALQRRIHERFPDSGLGRVAAELRMVANEAVERIGWIRKPNWMLRTAIWFLVGVIVMVLLALIATLEVPKGSDLLNFIQVLDAGLSAMFFIGAAVLFLTTWETRIKRKRVLRALHELRSMAHIVDMHQLTKDPEQFIFPQMNTASSPKRSLTPFELSRYLDYCSELLALISKIAALYNEDFDDPVILNAVDDVEQLGSELSQKIWQKLTILDSLKNVAK